MVRLGGLYYEKAFRSPSAASSAELPEKLDGSFVGPEILLAQEDVGLQHRHQGESAEVEALRNHLGAHKDIDASIGETVDGPFHIFAVLGGIAVKPGHDCVREQSGSLFLNSLGAASKWDEGPAAVRA